MLIYRLLFVIILFVCFLFVRFRISPVRIKLAASNFARWFRGVLGRESPTLGNFAPQKFPISPKSNESVAGVRTGHA